MNNDVLTVKQFAKIAGVSAQAVYKRINHKESDIQPYVVNRVNPQGKTQTYLKISILDDPELNPSNQPVNPVEQPEVVNQSTVDDQPINPVEQPSEEPETASGDALTAHLKEEVKFLREHIETLSANLQDEKNHSAEILKSLQFEQSRNRELEQQVKLLQTHAEDQPEPEPPEPPKKSFRAWWNNIWNSTTPQQ